MYLNLESLLAERGPEKVLDSLSWPVSEGEKAEIYDGLALGFGELLRDKPTAFTGLVLRACIPILLSSVFNSLYTNLVVSRVDSRKDSSSKFVPSNFDNFSWLLNGGQQDINVARTYLKRHVTLKKNLKSLLKKRWLSDEPDAVLTVNPTLEKYLELENIEVSNSAFTEWFNFWDLNTQRKTNTDYRYPNLVLDGIVDAIDPSYRSDKLLKSVQMYVANTLAFAEHRLLDLSHLSRVKKTRRLFTGTQGFIGTRLVSLSVLDNGGEVFSFPHSGGSMLYLGQNWCVEDLTSSVTFCYTKHDKSKRERNRPPIDSAAYPTLSVLPQGPQNLSNSDYSGTIKRVLYLGAGYPGDRFWPAVLPELLRLRLELEVIDALVSKNLEVTVKLHFKSTPQSITRFFKERFGGQVTFDDTPLRFSTADSTRFDAYISENITGGSLTEIIKTRKPVILITPFASERYIDATSLNLIKKRVSVIQCQEDSWGMPRLPVSELYRVLDRQKHTLDYTYVNQATNSLFYY